MVDDRAPIACTAPAKINLSLEILGRRADGYHELRSLVFFTRLGDRITVEAADALMLRLTGPFADGMAGEQDNLVMRAAKALQTASGVSAGARITLEKNLPIASGIGGGSADAAATLKALSRLWKTRLTTDEMFSLALSLGADVPVCMRRAPCMMGGIGEKLEPLESLPSFALLLVNPNAPVSTRDVFSRLAAEPVSLALPKFEVPRLKTMDDLVTWASAHPNDLERPARQLAPVISDVLTAIVNDGRAYLARMSGSGATCFGLYRDTNEADTVAQQLTKLHPGWWVATSDVLISADD